MARMGQQSLGERVWETETLLGGGGGEVSGVGEGGDIRSGHVLKGKTFKPVITYLCSYYKLAEQ